MACCLLQGLLFLSCKKLVSISGPIDTLTTEKMFNSEQQAEGAMIGVYHVMIHGTVSSNIVSVGFSSFSAGLATIAGGLSAGEFYNSNGPISPSYYALITNRLTNDNSEVPGNIWSSAYNTVYGANSVIEGIATSTSPQLRDSVRKELTGEAKFVRAFCYFYLTNFFGDLPLALTVDFNQTAGVAKTSQPEIYKQIISDLLDAESTLPSDYSVGKGKRVRPNKWAATAMLAKAYLFLGDHVSAAAKATDVINQAALYQLEPVNNVFKTTSREVIWELMQTEDPASALKNATPEGNVFLPHILYKEIAPFNLSDDLLRVFEPGDQRYVDWIDSTMNIVNGVSQGKTYYPAKYKVGFANSVAGAPAEEYYVVSRLAEQYLIRAEARANGANGGLTGAIDDLNKVRKRAGLELLPVSMDLAAVKKAIAQERQTELFAEWGNRWLDLKRTGTAHDVLSNTSIKQPWEGDYQLLYPIPPTEIQRNSRLTQNQGY